MVYQGVWLGSLLFLIYINDLNNAIAHSLVHHFADDANITFSHKALEKFNKFLNHDLSQLFQWLRPNRISQNASKFIIAFISTKLFHFRKKKIT